MISWPERRHLAVTFSVLVTAQKVRSYKPASGHFTTARNQIGARRWLHAAQGCFHDVEPAVAHGIPIAWINRKRERPTEAARPDREFRTLTELAEVTTPSSLLCLAGARRPNRVRS
jgi:2-haloacid dehalogenase/putative hydrolase of the HAD superfamily